MQGHPITPQTFAGLGCGCSTGLHALPQCTHYSALFGMKVSAHCMLLLPALNYGYNHCSNTLDESVSALGGRDSSTNQDTLQVSNR